MARVTEREDDPGVDGDDAESPAKKRIGSVVAGAFRLTRHIGSGGSSHVFEAEHIRLGKSFALKLLRPELELGRRTAQRFRREARALARIRCEHVISVVDCGELDDQTPYLVMELLEGQDLRSLLSSSNVLPARRAARIVLEACRGLRFVHEAGLVHRDLKPENLFIARRCTGEDWCKVLDFGVAKMETSLATAQGSIVGTVRYMAPEQLANGDGVGPTTDVYALGAILYECLSGRPAHTGDSIQEVMFSVTSVVPPPLSSLNAALPAALVETVRRCLAKAATERPQTMFELEQLLLGSFAGSSAGDHPTLSEDTPRYVSRPPRSPLGRWRFVGALLLASLGGAALSWSARLSSPAKAELPSTTEPMTTAPALAQRAARGASDNTQAPALPLPPAAPSVAAAAPTTATDKPPPPPGSAPRKPTSTTRPVLPAANNRPRSPTPITPVGGLDPANPYGE